jgi:hypothetical protein
MVINRIRDGQDVDEQPPASLASMFITFIVTPRGHTATPVRGAVASWEGGPQGPVPVVWVELSKQKRVTTRISESSKGHGVYS